MKKAQIHLAKDHLLPPLEGEHLAKCHLANSNNFLKNLHDKNLMKMRLKNLEQLWKIRRLIEKVNLHFSYLKSRAIMTIIIYSI